MSWILSIPRATGYRWADNMKLIDKYLLSDDVEAKTCFHCHDAKPEPRKTICKKCSKELAAWRAKKGCKKEAL